MSESRAGWFTPAFGSLPKKAALGSEQKHGASPGVMGASDRRPPVESELGGERGGATWAVLLGACCRGNFSKRGC
ncbi:MAG: hypothetical protein ACJ0UT_02490 [Candidatus Latescibacterota bacterium]